MQMAKKQKGYIGYSVQKSDKFLKIIYAYFFSGSYSPILISTKKFCMHLFVYPNKRYKDAYCILYIYLHWKYCRHYN